MTRLLCCSLVGALIAGGLSNPLAAQSFEIGLSGIKPTPYQALVTANSDSAHWIGLGPAVGAGIAVLSPQVSVFRVEATADVFFTQLRSQQQGLETSCGANCTKVGSDYTNEGRMWMSTLGVNARVEHRLGAITPVLLIGVHRSSYHDSGDYSAMVDNAAESLSHDTGVKFGLGIGAGRASIFGAVQTHSRSRQTSPLPGSIDQNKYDLILNVRYMVVGRH